MRHLTKFGLPPLSCPDWNDYCVSGYNPANGGNPPYNNGIGGNASGGTTNNPNVINVSNGLVNSNSLQLVDTSINTLPLAPLGLIDQLKQFAQNNQALTLAFFGGLIFLAIKK